VTVRLHIERIVVDGLALGAHSAGEMQAALEARLTELIETGATPEGFAGTIDFGAREGAGVLGTRAASSVYAALPQALASGDIPRVPAALLPGPESD
jgi:hypothetical protein